MTMITQKIEIKTIIDVGNHMFTKSVFYTPSLTGKTSEFPVSIVLMLIILINVKMLIMTKKKFNLDPLC